MSPFDQPLTRPSATAPASPPWPDWLRRARHSEPDDDQLTVRWLGTAAFEVRTRQATILIDPYFSRQSLWQLIAHPLRPDWARIEPHMAPAQAILVGHAHFDHLLDAPAIARRLGAGLYASQDALRVARAEGCPSELLNALRGGETLAIGDLRIEVITSAHSELITQRLVGGAMPETVTVPMRFEQYKCGPVFAFLIHWRGRTLYHCGSAEIREHPLEGKHAEVALFCINGWKADPSVFRRLHAALAPEVMVPMHHDDFFLPLERGVRVGPLVHEREAHAAIRRAMPRASLVQLGFFDALQLDPKEAP